MSKLMLRLANKIINYPIRSFSKKQSKRNLLLNSCKERCYLLYMKVYTEIHANDFTIIIQYKILFNLYFLTIIEVFFFLNQLIELVALVLSKTVTSNGKL